MTLWFSGSQLEVKERCTFLSSQSNAEEQIIYRANPQICAGVPHTSISTSFLKREWRSECTGKAKRTLAPSVFPSQLLTQWLVCSPSHLTGEVSGHTIPAVAAAIPALRFPQDSVALHPIGLYIKLGLQFRTRDRRTGQGNSGEGRGIETRSQIRGRSPGLAWRDIRSRKVGNGEAQLM